jgi:hypothetical protein
MDGPLVWSNQHHQSGTLMPSGTVHTIFASASEAIQLWRNEKESWIASSLSAFARWATADKSLLAMM